MPKLPKLHLLVAMALAVAAPVAGARSERPSPVSPGADAPGREIGSRCPTFSWGTVEGAEAYELIVYRVPDSASPLAATVPVLRTRVSGQAASWTPDLGDCLEPGSSYAWAIKALAKGGLSEWSEVRFFEIAAVPDPAEVARALEVLERFLSEEKARAEPVPEVRMRAEDRSSVSSAKSGSLPLAGSASSFTVDPNPLGLRIEVTGSIDETAAGVYAYVSGDPDMGYPFNGAALIGEVETQGADPLDGVQGISDLGSGVMGRGSVGIEGWGTFAGVQADGDLFGARLSSGEQAIYASGLPCCNGNMTANYAAHFENLSDEADPDVLALGVRKSNANSSMNFVAFFDGTLGNRRLGEIEGNGSGGVHFTGSAATVVSPSSDFAEYLPNRDPSERLMPGEVVGLYDGQVSRRTDEAEAVLVVTTEPLILGNKPAEGDQEGMTAVALLGQVPVKVRGPVRRGQIIVASGSQDGTAVAISGEDLTLERWTSVVGRALEGSGEGGIKPVRTAIGFPESTVLSALLSENSRITKELVERVARLERRGPG